MKNLAFLLLTLLPAYAIGQDYVMYELQYLTVNPDHANQLYEELSEHNKKFHGEGPYAASMAYVVNGPQTGRLVWGMGPTTFTDLDKRPSGDPHDGDWMNILSYCEKVSNVEYWVLDDDLSYVPEASMDESRPISRVRLFEVRDNELFIKVQGQIKKVYEAMGSKQPRRMYRRRFLHRDGRDWAAVYRFKNWSELDEESANFEETFKKVHGEAAWNTFDKEFDETVVGREDEWRQDLPELGGVN